MNTKPILKLVKCDDTDSAAEPAVAVDRSKYGSHVVNRSALQMDSSNQQTEFRFMNHESFEDYCGNLYAVNKPCQMCGRVYYDMPMMGVPLSTSHETRNGVWCIAFHMEGMFHSVECAYTAWLHIKRNILSAHDMNPLYIHTEELFNHLLSLMYPGGDTVDMMRRIATYAVDNYRPVNVSELPNILFIPVKSHNTVVRAQP
jgi:hypothetical protein